MAAPTGSTFVGAVDQGTSSTRFLIFDSQTGALLTYHQVSVNHIYPHEGWVEEDPNEILNSVYECIEKAVDNLKVLGLDPKCIKAIGITNQRETTVVWDNETGKPLYNAIVWMDARNGETARKLIESTPGNNKEYLKARCGLPISTYFSAVKMRWLLDNSDTVRKAVSEGRCCFGTVDSWLIWNLTKKSDQKGSIHVTDVTNASRTMLMNIHSLQWDPELYKFFNIPPEILPQIRSSSEIYGHMEHTVLTGVPISGVLGDQQAALVGQMCLQAGQAKNTYGTGCFLLYNTGTEIVMSDHGLLTTVAYQLGPGKPVYYALEGSVAVAGAAVQWLRDNLGIVQTSADIETLAASVDDTHGCYFVPAFTGLFCPYWEYDARGIICGLTQFSTKAHIARACLEATCFQTRELLDAMNQDSGISLKSLQVDGGMTANNLLMQLQADITGLTIERPSMVETTALGAAIAAGSASDVDVWRADKKQAMGMESFVATTTEADRNRRLQRWKEAVKRSMGWAREEHSQNGEHYSSIYTSMPLGFYVLSSFLIYLVTQRSSV